MAATRGTIAQTVSAEGTVAALATEDLSFSSSGTVATVNVKVGDVVSTGDVLATIDSAELVAAVADAKATVAEAEAKLADDSDSEASDAQIAADETALTTAQDRLTSSVEALAGSQLVATQDGTVTLVEPDRGRRVDERWIRWNDENRKRKWNRSYRRHTGLGIG
ncbi:MAG: biotin/lipoyl-binding protein [Microthrixaceae bacterium]